VLYEPVSRISKSRIAQGNCKIIYSIEGTPSNMAADMFDMQTINPKTRGCLSPESARTIRVGGINAINVKTCQGVVRPAVFHRSWPFPDTILNFRT